MLKGISLLKLISASVLASALLFNFCLKPIVSIYAILLELELAVSPGFIESWIPYSLPNRLLDVFPLDDGESSSAVLDLF